MRFSRKPTLREACLFDREAAHLPGDMESAVLFLWVFLEDRHAAMMAADVERVTALREEARNLGHQTQWRQIVRHDRR